MTDEPSSIRSIAWNPLGTLIATGSADRTLRVWNPERPSIRFSTDLKGHLAGVERVAWNPQKEAELCSVSSDGVVKFWDVKNKTCTNEVKGLGDAITMAWCPDGETLVVGNKVCSCIDAICRNLKIAPGFCDTTSQFPTINCNAY